MRLNNEQLRIFLIFSNTIILCFARNWIATSDDLNKYFWKESNYMPSTQYVYTAWFLRRVFNISERLYDILISL